jgi:hypothetical protein
MPSSKNKRVCLSCKHYRPTDETVGRCRLDRDTIDPTTYPVMTHEDCCESWRDVGQNYHIRIGWVRALAGNTNNDSDKSDSKAG